VAGATSVPIAIADDGELAGVREALRGLGHSFAEWQRPGPQPDDSKPSQLFVTSWNAPAPAGPKPARPWRFAPR
jgi:hypothetical protein